MTMARSSRPKRSWAASSPAIVVGTPTAVAPATFLSPTTTETPRPRSSARDVSISNMVGLAADGARGGNSIACTAPCGSETSMKPEPGKCCFHRLDDAGDESSRDGGIHGVPAALQHIKRGLHTRAPRRGDRSGTADRRRARNRLPREDRVLTGVRLRFESGHGETPFRRTPVIGGRAGRQPIAACSRAPLQGG